MGAPDTHQRLSDGLLELLTVRCVTPSERGTGPGVTTEKVGPESLGFEVELLRRQGHLDHRWQWLLSASDDFHDLLPGQ